MSLGRVHPLRSWSRKKKKSRNIACYLVVVVASNSIRVFVRDGDVLASSCICAGGTSSTRRRKRGSKTNGRRMVYAQPVVGGQVANISRKTGVAELARASRRKLLKRSLPSPSPTYHQKPLVSPPSTPGEPTLSNTIPPRPSPCTFHSVVKAPNGSVVCACCERARRRWTWEEEREREGELRCQEYRLNWMQNVGGGEVEMIIDTCFFVGWEEAEFRCVVFLLHVWITRSKNRKNFD